MTTAKLIMVHLLGAVVLSLPKCFEITDVRQPEVVEINQEFTIEVDVELTGKDGDQLVFGFLAPRAWRAAEYTSVSFTSTFGGSSMSLMPEDEVDNENKLPWAEQITDREGIGSNYGEVEWVVFKADNPTAPPGSTSPDNPESGTITIETRAGEANLITQLGYFVGEVFWGYLNDGNNSLSFFELPCIEVTGATGQAQNLCGPPPRQLLDVTTYTFDDILTITFDAQEDDTELIGASEVFFCSRAVTGNGEIEICDLVDMTSMEQIAPDVWSLTIWAPSYFGVESGDQISEILCNFQDANGTVVRDVSGNDFQILPKCF